MLPRFLFCAGVLIFAFFLSVPSAHAITISPSRQGVVIELGSSGQALVRVKNDGESVETFVPEVDAFSIDAETGRAVFGAAETAVGWVMPRPERLTLAPGQTGEFVFSIVVPEVTEVRSRYLGLFAKQLPGAGQVGIGARVGSLLFLHVSGEAREELTPVALYSDRKLVGRMPFSLTLILKNVGTIHVSPVGEVVAVNRGNKVVEQFSLNEKARKVLPGELWQESYVISELSLSDLGKITVHALARYGLSGQTLSYRMSFWYVPWYVLLAVGAGSAVVIVVFVRLIIKRRRAARLK